MTNPRDCEGNELPWSTRPCVPGDYDTPVCYVVPPSTEVIPGVKRITLQADCTATGSVILDQALAPVPGAVETGCPSPCSLCGGGGGGGSTTCGDIQALFPSAGAAIPGDEFLVERGGACIRVTSTGGIACPYEAPCDGSCAAPAYSFSTDPASGLFYEAGVPAVTLGFNNCDAFVRVGDIVRIEATNGDFLEVGASINLNAAVGDIVMTTGGVEHARWDSTGEYQLAGTPGVAGQYFGSNGPGTPPTWQTFGGAVFPLLAPAGSCAAPSYSFAAEPDTGMHLLGTALRVSAGTCTNYVEINQAAGGVTVFAASPHPVTISATGGLFVVSAATGAIGFSGAASITAGGGGVGALSLGAEGANLTLSTSTSGNVSIASIDDVLIAGDNLDISTGGSSRLTILMAGGFSIAGTEGAAGQVLTSNGSGTSPTWQTPAAAPSPATTVTVSDAGAGVVGVALTYAREDHKHMVATGVPVAVGTANSAGVATTLARSDHVHDHGSQPLGAGTNHAVATGAVAGFMSAADKTRFDALLPATTVTTTLATAGAVGVAVTYAREDHRHSVSTAAPSVTVKSEATAASVGIAGSVLRSDAQIQALTAAPVATGTANALGASSALARADHVHRTLVAVQSGGAAIGSRPTLNFISGSGITVTPVDSGGSDRVDITVALSGGTPGIVNNTAQARRTTTYTLTATFTDIDLQATDVETDSAVIDHLAGTPDRITAVLAGTYQVSYDIDIDSPTTNENTFEIQARVRVNDTGTGILGSQAEATVFNDASIEGNLFSNHLSNTFVTTLTAGQFLTLQLAAVDVGGGAAFPVTRASGVKMVVTRLRS